MRGNTTSTLDTLLFPSFIHKAAKVHSHTIFLEIVLSPYFALFTFLHDAGSPGCTSP